MKRANAYFSKLIPLLILIIAGESVFLLPFVLTRIFRPTFLKVFEISNYHLGLAFSVYGIIAMISYFFGGMLADRFSAKKLMSSSLIVTGILGFVLIYFRSQAGLTFIYGCFGITTILLFWAAFTKSTRMIGGRKSQGKSFGTVDAGRGLLAAIIASGSVLLFEAFLPASSSVNPTIPQLKNAFTKIIFSFSILTILSGILVWFLLPDLDSTKKAIKKKSRKLSFESVIKVSKVRSVRWQAVIVMCSYVGYKCTDDFSLFAADAFHYKDVTAAHFGTISFWIRPLAAITAGFLADRFQTSKIIFLHFMIMAVGSLLLGSGFIAFNFSAFFIVSIAISSVGIYGLRGLYFALFEEAKIPLKLTGSAIGLVSFIGFTPDIFVGPLMGYLTDHYQGALGHQILFLILCGFSLLGGFATVKFRKSLNIH